MAIDKIFDNASVDGIADNLFKSVSNSVSEVKAMQQRKAAENVQLVIQALKKIESDIQDKYDGVTTVIEKRVSSIKDGRDGRDGVDGKAGKDGRPGRDGATGLRGIDGKNGVDGVDGDDGVSVVDAHIDFDGSLIIGLSSGRAINVGEVVAPDLAEKIKVITNGGGTSQQVLDTLVSLQNQINAILTGITYQGTWNASTNTPTLTSSAGTTNGFYIVSVAGSTTLNGISNWGVGDWAIFNGTVWQRVEGGAEGNFTNLSVSGTTTLSGLTASTALALDASKNVVSVTNTGTGSNVLATSPTLVTPALGTPSSGVVTNLTGTASININGTVGATTPAAGTFTSLSDSGNLTFTGTGNRIIGDFSNATYANRVLFQTSTTNGASSIGVIPNGTGLNASFFADSDSAATNSSRFSFQMIGGADARLSSTILGTGTYLPMTFHTGGSEAMRIAVAAGGIRAVGIGYTTLTGVGDNGLAVLGNVGIGTSSPQAKLQTSTAADGAQGIFSGAQSTNEQTLLFRNSYYTNNATAGVAAIGWIDSGSSGGSLTFKTGTNGGGVTNIPTERMRIDSSGNVGIGGAPSGTKFFVLNDRAINTYSQKWSGYNGATFENDLVLGYNGATFFGNFQAKDLYFITNNTERMRIDSSGNVLVGTTTTDETAATGIILRAGNTGHVMQSINTATNSNHYLLYNLNATNTGYRFYVNANGGIYNYSANNVNLSDRREKTNFAPAGDYLSKICAIPIQTYNYIDQNLEEDGGLTLGVVAQDVQLVAPELVNESNWGTEEKPKMRLSIYQTDLQYALMKCIQEQQALITSLTARITALESKEIS